MQIIASYVQSISKQWTTNVNNVQFLLLLYIAVYLLFHSNFFYKRGMLRIVDSWVECKRTLMPTNVKVNGDCRAAHGSPLLTI